MMTALANAELKTIRVYGDLAKLLKQRTFKAAVRSPQDAIKFLLANFPEVESYILPRFFHIRVGEREIGEDDLEVPTGVFEEIRIIPAICGAGGGVGQIITGVALIAGSFLVPFAAPVLLPLGIGLTLTGIATFLTPTPSDRPESTDPSDSYNFNGVQQTSREGIPVPVVYGEIFTGSVVLSVKVEEDDEELEADFAAGAGDPNPDPNPVPDPETPIPGQGPLPSPPIMNIPDGTCVRVTLQSINLGTYYTCSPGTRYWRMWEQEVGNGVWPAEFVRTSGNGTGWVVRAPSGYCDEGINQVQYDPNYVQDQWELRGYDGNAIVQSYYIRSSFNYCIGHCEIPGVSHPMGDFSTPKFEVVKIEERDCNSNQIGAVLWQSSRYMTPAEGQAFNDAHPDGYIP